MILVQDLLLNDVTEIVVFSEMISAVACEQHPKSTRLTANYHHIYGIVKIMQGIL